MALYGDEKLSLQAYIFRSGSNEYMQKNFANFWVVDLY